MRISAKELSNNRKVFVVHTVIPVPKPAFCCITRKPHLAGNKMNPQPSTWQMLCFVFPTAVPSFTVVYRYRSRAESRQRYYLQ
mmetsp:Transcript_14969/g.33783  ORF Transcript_14969/g.33783 Transcript_14969/m.33783 type:complete len:83 (-) Transcript_14969:912-1160(-)